MCGWVDPSFSLKDPKNLPKLAKLDDSVSILVNKIYSSKFISFNFKVNIHQGLNFKLTTNDGSPAFCSRCPSPTLTTRSLQSQSGKLQLKSYQRCRARIVTHNLDCRTGEWGPYGPVCHWMSSHINVSLCLSQLLPPHRISGVQTLAGT